MDGNSGDGYVGAGGARTHHPGIMRAICGCACAAHLKADEPSRLLTTRPRTVWLVDCCGHSAANFVVRPDAPGMGNLKVILHQVRPMLALLHRCPELPVTRSASYGGSYRVTMTMASPSNLTPPRQALLG
jgi:hypothetical protein